MTAPAMIALGERAKSMSGLYGLRDTVRALPAQFDVQVLTAEVREWDRLGPGCEFYEHQEYRVNDDPAGAAVAPAALEDDDSDESGNDGEKRKKKRRAAARPPSALYLIAADESGRTVALYVPDARFPLYVQMKWGTKVEAESLARDVEHRFALPSGSLPYEVHARSHYCGWEPDPADPRKTRSYAYCVLQFGSAVLLRWAAAYLRTQQRYAVHESQIDGGQKALESVGVAPGEWLRVRRWRLPDRFHTHAQIEVQASRSDLEPVAARDDVAPLYKLAWDTEWYSPDGSFPDPTRPGVHPICINSCVKQHDRPWTEAVRVCHYYAAEGAAAKIEAPAGVHLVRCTSPMHLLETWRDFAVLDVQAQVDVGFNTFGFDNEALATLAEHEAPGSRYFRQSLFCDDKTPLRRKPLSNAMKGDNELCYLRNVAGRFSFDVYLWVKEQNKDLRSYSLRAICEHYFPDDPSLRKIDLEPEELFRRYREGDHAAIVRYGDKDAELPLRLEEQMQATVSLVQMGRIMCTPVAQILTYGLQVRILNMLLRYAHRCGFVMNEDPQRSKPGESVDEEEETTYEGARVIEPKPGYYLEPIDILDYQSLYPSIMQEENLCFSTIVRRLEWQSLPGVAYRRFRPRPDKENVFVDESVLKGVLPRLLQELKTARTAVRAEQKKFAQGSRDYNLREGRQLALKVAANAVYGFYGVPAKRAMMPCVEISETVTCIGRDMIDLTAKSVEQDWSTYLAKEPDWVRDEIIGAEVIYGDSVPAETPVLCRGSRSGVVQYRCIGELVDPKGWEVGVDGKESAAPGADADEVWSDTGFTRIERVIRHATTKSMHRVCTPTGCVDVTEDHSLLRPSGEEVRPGELVPGTTALMHCDLPALVVDDAWNELDAEHAFLLGLFAEAGDSLALLVPTWRLEAIEGMILDRAYRAIERLEPEYRFRIVERNPGYGRGVELHCGPANDVRGAALAQRWRRLFYGDSRFRSVPPPVLRGSERVRRAFFDGYCAREGYWCGHRHGAMSPPPTLTVLHTIHGPLDAATLYHLARSIGFHVTLDCTRPASNVTVYVLRCFPAECPIADNPDLVSELMPYPVLSMPPPERVVYDLQTANHHFAAGVGRLVVHNTDSVMVRFRLRHPELLREKRGIEIAIAAGQAAARHVTSKFHRGNIVLVPEHTLRPFILYRKKRYAGLPWSKKAEPEAKPMAKGVDSRRRDNWLGLKTACDRILWTITVDGNLDAAKKVVLDLLDDVVEDRLPLDAYISSKSLKKNYSKSTTAPVHVRVRDRIRARKPGSEPKSGNRVPYVIVESGDAKASVGDRAEDPEYVRKLRETEPAKAPRLDRKYYLETLVNPISTILEPCFDNVKALFADPLRRIDHQRRGFCDIRSFTLAGATTTPSALVESDRARTSQAVKPRSADVAYVPEWQRKQREKAARAQKRPVNGGIDRFFVSSASSTTVSSNNAVDGRSGTS